jgi:cell division protein FtsB
MKRNRIAAEEAEMERLRTANERLKKEIEVLRQHGNI